MKKAFSYLIAAILLIGLLTSGCTSEAGSATIPAATPEVSTAPDDTPAPGSTSEFSVFTGTKSISLQAWDNDIELDNILGTAASEDTKVLDQSSDTFAGSYVKKLKYQGLELELFSPKDNGKTYWIKDIAITGGDYKTAREIGIGSDVAELTEKYPEILQLPDGRTDPNNCAYIYKDDTGFSNILFEVKEGKTVSIRLYQEMP